MNLENFTDFLEQPTRLYQLNYEELKNLVLAYPYNPNLRLLLWMKGQMEHDPRAQQYLHRVAAATFDRAHLFDLSKQVHKAEVQEDRMELRELTELFRELAVEPVPNEQAPPQLTAVVFPTPPPPAADIPHVGIAKEEEELLFDFFPAQPVPATQSEPQTQPEPRPENDFARQRLHQMLARRKKALLETPPAAPAPEQPSERQHEPPRKKINTKAVEQIARKSVTENEELASETLAKLLVQQGQYARALRMYEKLCLLFPEKMPIFAPIIENLQQKI